MKTAEARNAHTSQTAQQEYSLFSKGRDAMFFHGTRSEGQKKPFFDVYHGIAGNELREAATEATIHPPVQTKCEACEWEEKLQKKGEEDLESGTLTKLSAGAPGNSPNLESQLSSSKGRGVPIPPDTRKQMEASFGADFSTVKVHTDGNSVHMNSDLGAQAFTHGTDIYFNRGKYEPHSSTGRHLLAHELTHVVQQGIADRKTDGKGGSTLADPSASGDGVVRRLAFEDLKYTSPLWWNYRAAKWVGGKAWQGVGEITGRTDRVHLLSSLGLTRGKQDYYDIRGKSSFSPDLGLWLHILDYFETYRTNRVPVKIKYGKLGRGTLMVQADSNYNFSTTGNFIIGLDHPAIRVQSSSQALALEVRISGNKISGEMGVARNRSAGEMNKKMDMPLVNHGGFKKDDLYEAILGESYDDGSFREIVFNNHLTGGMLHFLMGGLLDLPHHNTLLAILSIVDDQNAWKGELNAAIKGAEPYTLEVERTPGGLLSGVSAEMKLGSSWKSEGFALDGGLHIVYAEKAIEIFGSATYKSKRAEGSVHIAVLPQHKAQTLFREHVPVKGNEEATTGAEKTAEEQAKSPLALTAWGNFRFKLIDKAKMLSGSGAFVVSPEGYIVSAGQLKLQKEFILMDTLARDHKLFEDEMSAKILVAGVPVRLSLRGSINAGYRIGPVAMYELLATGAYSNHPEYPSELCLEAKFEMPANLYVSLDLIAAAGISVGYRYLSITVVEVGGKLTARADLNAYVNAKPAIGVRQIVDGEPEYCLMGRLYAGGELVVSLSTGLEISVFRKIKTDSGGEEKKPIGKKDSFANWTIGDFGFELGMDYTLGKDEKPDFTYTGGKFDKAGFLRALRRKGKAGKKSDPELKGGFVQEGEQKGVVSDESIKGKEVSESDQPLGPFELSEDFKMNGTPHRLFLSVGGTEGKPAVRVEMASSREELIEKIDEEIAALEKVRSHVWLLLSGELTEEKIKLLGMRINRLVRLRERTEHVEQSVEVGTADPETPADISAPGFESLDDELEEFGDQFGVNDLGEVDAGTTPEPVEELPTVGPPEGMDVILVLPPQKAIHLKLYRSLVNKRFLQHRIEREERDTDQLNTWQTNLGESMPRGTFCQGRGLGLSIPDIYRPYWSERYLDASRRTRRESRGSADIPRMQVDHVIEWQVRPLAEAEWVDQPWNLELMDASSNVSSGPRMRGNINRERRRLAAETGDDGWLDRDITFTKVIVEGSASAERWSYEEIEDGDHLDTYRILTGETVDPEKEKEC